MIPTRGTPYLPILSVLPAYAGLILTSTERPSLAESGITRIRGFDSLGLQVGGRLCHCITRIRGFDSPETPDVYVAPNGITRIRGFDSGLTRLPINDGRRITRIRGFDSFLS